MDFEPKQPEPESPVYLPKQEPKQPNLWPIQEDELSEELNGIDPAIFGSD